MCQPRSFQAYHFYDPVLLAKHKEPELMEALHQFLELVTISAGA